MEIKPTKTPLRVAFPTDEHHPFQDDKAIALAMKIVSDFDPQVITAGSDGMDFYSISRFDKNPARMREHNLQNEIDAWQTTQRAWRDAAPNATPYWFPGNHEDRLRQYLWRHPEFMGLRVLEIPHLLEFEALGIHPSPVEELYFTNQLIIRHGDVVRKHSAYTANAELFKDLYQVSTMSGHTHRGGVSYASSRGRMVQGHECFCLCDLNPEYVRNPNWQQGIVLAEVSSTGLSIEQIPFSRRGKRIHATWRGKRYTA